MLSKSGEMSLNREVQGLQKHRRMQTELIQQLGNVFDILELNKREELPEKPRSKDNLPVATKKN